MRNSSIGCCNPSYNTYKNEKMYYIIREDGSSLFELPYREEFIYHCLIKLLDIADGENFRLLQFADNMLIFNYIPISKVEDLSILK